MVWCMYKRRRALNKCQKRHKTLCCRCLSTTKSAFDVFYLLLRHILIDISNILLCSFISNRKLQTKLNPRGACTPFYAKGLSAHPVADFISPLRCVMAEDELLKSALNLMRRMRALCFCANVHVLVGGGGEARTRHHCKHSVLLTVRTARPPHQIVKT